MKKMYIYFMTILLLCIFGYFIVDKFKNDSKVNEGELSDEEIESELIKNANNYEEYLAENPKDTEALKELVHLKYTLGEFEEAMALCSKLIELEPENHMNYYQMANIKTSLREWDSAIEYREKSFALAKTPDMLYYLSTNYVITDEKYALKLLDDLSNYEIDPEDTFYERYKTSLEKYIQKKNYESISGLAEFIPNSVIIDEIIQLGISNATSTEEVIKLNELAIKINGKNTNDN